MAPLPEASSDLFARKGRALPACSERLVKRPAHQASPAPVSGNRQTPGPAKDEAQEGGPGSVLSIDLRAALMSVPAPGREAAPVLSPPAAIAPPPRPQGDGMAGPLIAAVVAISIAGGLFYVFGPQLSRVTPVADAPAVAPPAAAPAGEQDAASIEEPTRTAPAAEPPDDRGVASKEDEAGADTDVEAGDGGTLPSFDLVRVERDGAAVIAGRAAPYAELILLHNGEPIGTAKADWAGEWAFVTDRPLTAEKHTIAVLVNDPDAEITLPDGAEPPARMSDSIESVPR